MMSEKITTLRKYYLNSKEKIDEFLQALANAIQDAMKVSTSIVRMSSTSKANFDWKWKQAKVKPQRLRNFF